MIPCKIIKYILYFLSIASMGLSSIVHSGESPFIPDEIEIKHANDSEESLFTYWPHAIGTIENEKLFAIQLRSSESCTFAIYKLHNDKYHFHTKTNDSPCKDYVDVEFIGNTLEIKISEAFSGGDSSSAFKFSKHELGYALIGIEQRYMTGNRGKIFRETRSINLLTSRAEIVSREYCAKTEYKLPCKKNRKMIKFNLGKPYYFTDFDHERIEAEIRNKIP